MALYYTRLLCRRNFDLRHFRSLYTCSPAHAATTSPLNAGSTICETHDERNMRLKRPMSPHLTIYQVQLTSLLSITHRTTGIIFANYAMILAFGTLFVPGGIPCLIEIIEGLKIPDIAFCIGKVSLALPVTFHYMNGLRHLAWDLGMFLNIKSVYSTGYATVGAAAVLAVVLALL